MEVNPDFLAPCGLYFFRGAKRRHKCKSPVDVDKCKIPVDVDKCKIPVDVDKCKIPVDVD